jgi:hypothetical protein
MSLNISECSINKFGHLQDKNKKLVLIQIGRELFVLTPTLTIRDASELKLILDKHNVQLLKESD